MATYFKYAEREADSYVNWAEIGKSMSDMLKTENQIREDKKSAIDKASREYGEQLANAPQGEHKGLNQWALEYSSDAQQARLMQDKLLKSGQLKLKDYVVMRQNINDGTNQAFDLMKEYNTEYSNKMERMKAEQNQDLEPWLMGEAEGFANFSQTKLYINPTDGTLSVAKMMDGPDGVRTMSNDPNDFTTVNELRNRIKSHFDRFDVAANVGAYVNGLGQEINVLSDLKNKYQRGTITEILDITDRAFLGNDGDVVMDFVDAETKMLEGMMTNPYNVSSILTNSVNFENTSGKEYTFTWKEEEAKANPNLILLRNDPKSGLPMPDFSEQQRKDALIYLRTQARLMYDKTEKMTVVGANEKSRAAQWEVMGAQEKTDRRNLLEQWMKISTAQTAAEKDAAAESLMNALPNYNKGIVSVDPTPTGVVLKFQDGKEETIEYKQGDVDKAGEVWAAAGTLLHGIQDQNEFNRYKGARFNDLDATGWTSVEAKFNMGVPPSTEVDPYALFNSTTGKITSDIFGDYEDATAKELQSILAPLNIKVVPSGGTVSNYVTVILPNGKEARIGTNAYTEGGKNEFKNELINFLDVEMKQKQDVLQMAPSDGGVGGKYN